MTTQNNNDNNQSIEQTELTAQQDRRKFISKFGKLAIATPVALTSLMSPSTSAALTSEQLVRFCQRHPNHRKCNGSGF